MTSECLFKKCGDVFPLKRIHFITFYVVSSPSCSWMGRSTGPRAASQTGPFRLDFAFEKFTFCSWRKRFPNQLWNNDHGNDSNNYIICQESGCMVLWIHDFFFFFFILHKVHLFLKTFTSFICCVLLFVIYWRGFWEAKIRK